MYILDCGELKRGESWGINEYDGTADVYPAWPDDWEYFSKVTEDPDVSIFRIPSKLTIKNIP